MTVKSERDSEVRTRVIEKETTLLDETDARARYLELIRILTQRLQEVERAKFPDTEQTVSS